VLTLRGTKDGWLPASDELALNDREGSLKLSPAYVRQQVKTKPGAMWVNFVPAGTLVAPFELDPQQTASLCSEGSAGAVRTPQAWE
jgi:hypothetical protein